MSDCDGCESGVVQTVSSGSLVCTSPCRITPSVHVTVKQKMIQNECYTIAKIRQFRVLAPELISVNWSELTKTNTDQRMGGFFLNSGLLKAVKFVAFFHSSVRDFISYTPLNVSYVPTDLQQTHLPREHQQLSQ